MIKKEKILYIITVKLKFVIVKVLCNYLIRYYYLSSLYLIFMLGHILLEHFAMRKKVTTV